MPTPMPTGITYEEYSDLRRVIDGLQDHVRSISRDRRQVALAEASPREFLRSLGYAVPDAVDVAFLESPLPPSYPELPAGSSAPEPEHPVPTAVHPAVRPAHMLCTVFKGYYKHCPPKQIPPLPCVWLPFEIKHCYPVHF